MRRHQHAHIDAHRLFPAYAFHFAFFQHAQELGLHVQGHVANLVKKQRPMLRLFEFAHVPSGRAGERAFLMPEQFGLNQLGRNRRAIQCDERTGGSPLRSCNVRATNSLPVPVSPSMHTRVSLGATRSIWAMMRRIASPCQTISCLPSCCLS